MKQVLTAAALAALLAAPALVLEPGAAAVTRDGGPQAARVLVVTDCGAEPGDAWALTRVARAAGLELAGVVGTHAAGLTYPPAKTAAANARALLAGLGRADVPVAAGLNHYFGDEQDIKPGPGADLLLEKARGHTRERPLQVLLLGPATDVALALMVDPSLGDRIQVVASAFDGWPRGGDAGNVKADPLAWQLLLQSRAALVVADATVAKRDLQPGDAQKQAIAAATKRLPPADRPLRDLGPVAFALGLAQAVTHPRPRLNPDRTLALPPKATDEIRWITAIEGGIWAY